MFRRRGGAGPREGVSAAFFLGTIFADAARGRFVSREAAQAQVRNLRPLRRSKTRCIGAENDLPALTKFRTDTPVTLRRKNPVADLLGWSSHSTARARRGRA